MSKTAHEYSARIVWDGNTGEGTAAYDGYGRQYRALIAGKPDIAGTADAAFRGEPHKHNPEDLFLSAISSCHLLSYLALCARRGIVVLAYEDDAWGRMVPSTNGGGKFEEVVLRPRVTIAAEKDRDAALQMHETAHELCYIANSCSVPIRHEATIETRDRPGGRSR